VCALMDGLPMENHPQLLGRLLVDDPDGWASTYPVIDRKHGTGIACNAISRLWKPKGLFARRVRQTTSNIGSRYGRDAVVLKLATNLRHNLRHAPLRFRVCCIVGAVTGGKRYQYRVFDDNGGKKPNG
jgi:hypothetical protein